MTNEPSYKKSLAYLRPDLAKEWHPEKNDDLKPEDVTPFSNQCVWWFLPFDDIKTGKHFDFEWKASISNRSRNSGCPFLTGHAVWKGFNDLVTLNPKLAKEWHPIKNGNLKPDNVSSRSNQEVWWYLPYDDPKSGKHFDFEWQAKIKIRNNGAGCPYLTGNSVWKGFNDLATLRPDLAKEWHPVKNGTLRPDEVTVNSSIKVWWYLPYDDPESGKHFDFEWSAIITNRSIKKCGCPYLSGKTVWKGYNDLATLNPDLAKEWHPTKNGELTPNDVTMGSHLDVWWYLP